MVILVHELAQAPRPLPPCCSDVSKLASPPQLGWRGKEGGSMSFPLREHHCYIFICIYISAAVSVFESTSTYEYISIQTDPPIS